MAVWAAAEIVPAGLPAQGVGGFIVPSSRSGGRSGSSNLIPPATRPLDPAHRADRSAGTKPRASRVATTSTSPHYIFAQPEHGHLAEPVVPDPIDTLLGRSGFVLFLQAARGRSYSRHLAPLSLLGFPARRGGHERGLSAYLFTPLTAAGPEGPSGIVIPDQPPHLTPGFALGLGAAVRSSPSLTPNWVRLPLLIGASWPAPHLDLLRRRRRLEWNSSPRSRCPC